MTKNMDAERQDKLESDWKILVFNESMKSFDIVN